ncbi:hypothetical protein H5407_21270 [Mitsuaria sp. WAJ17]|uniref:hypothetical protein n=1 Tax=Mitsuaria sp. WAJ17 TaxID=2761452 RepID=UPI0016017813|nr:hypothetical protein [Mitsuaria sp. WAJ17]MBB2487775.1 hypothetical protein [Mitsuaria sp. WAJ17]
MSNTNESLRVLIVDPQGERPIGAFTYAGSDFKGKGLCGVLYAGSYEFTPDGGAAVRMIATIPKGTRIGQDLITEEERTRELNFHLTSRQVAGDELKSLMLPGFGRARLRFAFGTRQVATS